MPDAAAERKPVLFGDLSYYWIIDRASVGIKVLKELSARNGQIGYLAHEHLDAKLIRPEAVKVLAITQEQG